MLAWYKEGDWKVPRRCVESVKIIVLAKTGEDIPKGRIGQARTDHGHDR